MKKIYEIPEVTIFEVGTCDRLLAGAGSVTEINEIQTTGSQLGNSNYLDDQSTPWYRR